jgi:sporulation protein YlmC with PRC-barrel domain
MPVGPRVPVTDLAGKAVYASDGAYVGRVVDLVLDLHVGGAPALALGDVNEAVVGALPDGAAGVRVPYRDVRAVEDAVVLAPRTGEAVVPATDPDGLPDADGGGVDADSDVDDRDGPTDADGDVVP